MSDLNTETVKAGPLRSSTLADVAQRAGVTKAAASFAFSGKRRISESTRERIFAAARELGYHPNPHAQRLSAGIAHKVVGLFSLTLDHIAWQSMSRIHWQLAARGYEAPLYSYGYSTEEPPDYEPLLATMCRQLPEGVICNTFKLPAEACRPLQEYRDKGGTLVCLHTALDMDCDQVLFDRVTNTVLAVRHLVEAGHRDIGLCSFLAPDMTNERIRGFMQGLDEAGIECNKDWLFESGYFEEGGARLAQEFLAMKKRPTGICIVNDIQAAAFVHQVLLAGLRVPEDVSVVALDNLPASLYGMVKLTTVTQPWEMMAEKAVDFLLDRLDGTYSGEPRQITFTGEVISRDSVQRL